MQNTRKTTCPYILALLTLLLLFALLLPIAATGAPQQNAPETAGVYDAITLYELFLSEDVPDFLSGYLAHETELSFDARTLISASDVTARYVEAGLLLEGHALTQEKDGITATLIPRSATFLGRTTDFEKTSTEDYTLLLPLEGSTATLDECTVHFSCTVTADDTVSELLLNGAYRNALALDAARAAYERDKAAHDEKVSLYESYLDELEAYEKASALHRAASEAHARYLRALAAYEAYGEAYTAYLASKAAYEAYEQAQLRYEDERDAYEQAYEAWRVYEEKASLYRTQLAQYEANVDRLTVLESAYIKNDTKHVFYETLMGNTVTTVVENKDEIVRAAGDWDGLPAAIDDADLATKNLRVLLTDYKKKQTHEEKYTYYREHYAAIKENFQRLYASLKHLFDNPVVRARITQEGKRERYKQFIAHLFVVSSCLDDQVVLDTSYTIDGATIDSLVTGDTRIPDTRTADPSAFPFVSKPTQIEPVARPTEPTPPVAVAKPTEPTEVKRPDPVPDPGKAPTRPETVLPAGDPPTPLSLTKTEADLLAAYDRGLLTERKKETPCEATLSLETRVIPTLDGVYTVSYYDESGTRLLYSERVDIGSLAAYVGDAPTKPSDARFHYTFRGFCDASGTLYEDSFLPNGNIRLYASFTETPVLYTVTFDVDGKTVSAQYPYGAIPTPPARTQKTPDDEYVYTFAGFLPKVGRVTGDCTYTATYTATKRMYTIIYDIGGYRYETRLPYGAVPECTVPTEREMDGTYAYEFLGFSPALASVTGNATYTALYRKSACAVNADGTPLAVEASEDTLTVHSDTDAITLGTLLSVAADSYRLAQIACPSYSLTLSPESADALARAGTHTLTVTENEGRYALVFADVAGTSLDIPPTALHLSLDVSDYDVSRLCALSDSGALLPVDVKDGTLHLTLKGAQGVTLRLRAIASVRTHEGGTLKLSAPIASLFVGDALTLTPSARYGYRFESVLLLYTETGERVTLYGDYFILPSETVEIIPQFSRITYTVTYRDGDTVLSSSACALGDEEPPCTPPVKDGWQFLRWEKSGSLEDGEIIYTAVYTEIVQANPDVTYKKDYGGWHFRDFIPHAIVVVLCITSLSVLTVLLVRKHRRRRK